MNIKKYYPYILIVCSSVGLLASFLLTLDTIRLIKNPGIDLPCNVNPFISCTSVANAWQGSIFGFPNSILGIIFFTIFLTVGFIIKTENISNRKTRIPLLVLSLGGIISVFWFFYQSVFVIGSLCMYCMVVWTITWPIFLYTTIWNISLEKNEEYVKNNFIIKNNRKILILFYIVTISLIIFNFRDFLILYTRPSLF